MRLLLLFLSGIVFTSVKSQEISFRDSVAFYYKKNDIKNTIKWAIEDVRYQEGNRPSTDSLYSDGIIGLGFFYRKNGQYVRADSCYRIGLTVIKEKYKEESYLYAQALSKMASLKFSMGNFTESETLFKNVFSLLEKLNLSADGEYFLAKANLGTLYIKVENYKEAERLYEEVINYYKNVQKDSSSRNYLVLNSNLSIIYNEQGNYSESERLIRKTIELNEKKGDTLSLEYGDMLSNLGSTAIRQKKYEFALECFSKVLKIVRRINGEDSPQAANTYNEIASTYRYKGMFQESTTYFIKAAEIQRKTIGEVHPSRMITLIDLAGVLHESGNSEQADSIVKVVLAYYKTDTEKLSTNNINGLTLLLNIALAAKREAEVEKFNSQLYELQKKSVEMRLDYMNEQQLMAYLSHFKYVTDQTFLSAEKIETNSICKSSYQTALFYKAIILENAKQLSDLLTNSGDLELKGIWKNLLSAKNYFAKSMGQQSQKVNTDSLLSEIARMEKYILEKSLVYKLAKNKLNTSIQNILENLSSNEVAIEFVRYSTHKILDKETKYAAIITRKGEIAPNYIYLTDEDNLIAALKGFSYKAEISSGNQTQSPNKSIYSLLWQPLEKHLTGIKKIYFSPDGLLHQIAFAAIPTPDKKLLSDKYQLVQLTSTRELMNKDTAIRPKSAMFFGGIDYNSQNTDTTTKANLDAYAFVYQQSHRGIVDSFRYLNHTLPEVQTAGQQLSKLNTKTYLYQGTNASESNFRSAIQTAQPSILHFATHGFTITDSTAKAGVNTAYTATKNPLLRTGLVMAGGNNGWKARNKWDEDDGILTGMEIANLRLDSTELVVLSACETANGEIQGSEGVFGLQRAFKLAGAKYIMATLWQVPDKETKEFMNLFYSRLAVKNTTIPDAFYYTQKTMRKKYPPFYWAGFTLIK